MEIELQELDAMASHTLHPLFSMWFNIACRHFKDRSYRYMSFCYPDLQLSSDAVFLLILAAVHFSLGKVSSYISSYSGVQKSETTLKISINITYT